MLVSQSGNQDDWRTQPFRQNLVRKIEDAIHQCGAPTTKNAVEMENQVFAKAKTREEYLSFVGRLIMHITEMAAKNKALGSGLMVNQNQGNAQQMGQVSTGQQMMNMQQNNNMGMVNTNMNMGSIQNTMTTMNSMNTMSMDQNINNPMMSNMGMTNSGGLGKSNNFVMGPGGQIQQQQQQQPQQQQQLNQITLSQSPGLMQSGLLQQLNQPQQQQLGQQLNQQQINQQQLSQQQQQQLGQPQQHQMGQQMFWQNQMNSPQQQQQQQQSIQNNNMTLQGQQQLQGLMTSQQQVQQQQQQQQQMMAGANRGIPNPQQIMQQPARMIQPNMASQLSQIAQQQQQRKVRGSGPSAAHIFVDGVKRNIKLAEQFKILFGRKSTEFITLAGVQYLVEENFINLSEATSSVVPAGYAAVFTHPLGLRVPAAPAADLEFDIIRSLNDDDQDGTGVSGSTGAMVGQQQQQQFQTSSPMQRSMGPGQFIQNTGPVMSMAPSPGSMNVQGQMTQMTNQGYQNSPSSGGMMHSPAGPGMNANTLRPYGNQMVPSPSGISLNTPHMAAPTPSPRNPEDQACFEKIKELRRYTDLLQRMIAKIGNEDVEKSSKMKKLLEILTNPNQRVSMEILLKCEIALKKMERQHDAGVGPTSVPSQAQQPQQPQQQVPTATATVAPGKETTSPFQQFHDAIITTYKFPSSAHTYRRTFQPIIDMFVGSNIGIDEDSFDESDEDFDPYPCPDGIPWILGKELDLLDKSIYRVNIVKRIGISDLATVAFTLVDGSLPTVPPLTISISKEYPEEGPNIVRLHDDYGPTPFLRAVAESLKSRMLYLSGKIVVTELLRCWMMSVRQAADPDQTLYKVTPISSLLGF